MMWSIAARRESPSYPHECSVVSRSTMAFTAQPTLAACTGSSVCPYVVTRWLIDTSCWGDSPVVSVWMP
ncbi:hypothetical protein SRABI128_01290 [Microbacterium sp. Bi128]|nr:hypothetical protein SRABI128_01290 [Microbacterium sp. Bi128]